MEKKIAPSERKTQELEALLQGQLEAQRGQDLLSTLVRLSTERVLQEAWEDEQAMALGRERYERRDRTLGYRNGYESGTLKTAEGVLRVQVPPRHQQYVRTSNLAERAFEEERRRTKVIPHLWDEGGLVKLVFAVLMRISERWGKKCFSEFEQQLAPRRFSEDLPHPVLGVVGGLLQAPAQPQPLDFAEHLAPKQRPHHRHGQEKAGANRDPGTVHSQSAATHQAVHVRMES